MPKLPHGLQSHIEPTLHWPCSAGHSFDGNAILQSIIAFLVTSKDLMETVSNQALKAWHVAFEDSLGFLFNTGVCN